MFVPICVVCSSTGSVDFYLVFVEDIYVFFERTETLDGALQTLIPGLFAQSFREDLVGGLKL